MNITKDFHSRQYSTNTVKHIVHKQKTKSARLQAYMDQMRGSITGGFAAKPKAFTKDSV